MMAVYMAWMLYEIWCATKAPGVVRPTILTVKKCAAFFLGVLVPTLTLVIYCSTYENGLSNAWFFYIENASAHVQSMFSSSFLAQVWQTFGSFIGLSWYNALFVPVLLSILLLILFRPRLTSNWVFSGLILLSALFAMLRTGSFFHHYMVFLAVPSLFFLIATLRLMNKKENILLITMMALWILLFHSFFSNIQDQIKNNKQELIGKNQFMTELSQFIVQQTGPDDYIALWGWDFRLHVYTNRRSATAQGNIERIWTVESDPDEKWSNRYPRKNLDVFLHGLKTNKPKLIIDMVFPGAFGFYEEKYTMQNNREVWEVVKDDYDLIHLAPVNGGSLRIYARKSP
jgi:hypothetical protein